MVSLSASTMICVATDSWRVLYFLFKEAQRIAKSSHKESARYRAECLKYENDLLQREEDATKLVKRFEDQKEWCQNLKAEVPRYIHFICILF